MKLIALERKELISILNQLKPLIDAFNQAGAPIHNQITMVYPNYCLRHYHRQQQPTTRPFPTLLQQQQQQITLPHQFSIETARCPKMHLMQL